MSLVLEVALAYPRQVKLDVVTYNYISKVQGVLEYIEAILARLLGAVVKAKVVYLFNAQPLVAHRDKCVTEIRQGCR
jgi:hypothetical protein